jgi:hypothetical protein
MVSTTAICVIEYYDDMAGVARCSISNLTVHHQRYRSHSGEDLEQNLITVCADCHSGGTSVAIAPFNDGRNINKELEHAPTKHFRRHLRQVRSHSSDRHPVIRRSESSLYCSFLSQTGTDGLTLATF